MLSHWYAHEIVKHRDTELHVIRSTFALMLTYLRRSAALVDCGKDVSETLRCLSILW